MSVPRVSVLRTLVEHSDITHVHTKGHMKRNCEKILYNSLLYIFRNYILKTKMRLATQSMLNFFIVSMFHFACGEDFELTVLHTNDVHAHVEQFNKYGGTCDSEAAQKNECFGGVARRQTVIDKIREANPNNTILIDGGDQFSGSLWFTIYGGKAAVTFMNYSKYDAMVSSV